MRNLFELNVNEAGSPVVRPAPTPVMIDSFQYSFGIVLPEACIGLLRFAHVGHPELDAVQPTGRAAVSAWDVKHFYCLYDNRTSRESLRVALAAWRTELGKNAVTFAEDGCGNPFPLHLKDVPQAVKFYLHDNGCSTVYIAP